MTSPTPNLSTNLDKAAYFANDPGVLEPLAAAMERAGVAIMSEGGDTEGHTLRVNLAIQVLQNPLGLAPRFAWALSTNETIVGQWAGEQRDAAVNSFQSTVESVWNAVAGVNEAEAAPAPAA